MARIIEKIKSFFGKCVCRPKEKPAQPKAEEETKAEQQESKPEQSKTEHEPF